MDELGPAEQHAAEILRPWAVDGAVDDRMSDLAVAKLLCIGRGGQESVDLPINEKILRMGRWVADPVDVLGRIKADEFYHEAHKVPGRRIVGCQANRSAFQVGNPAHVIVREEFEATNVHTSSHS